MSTILRSPKSELPNSDDWSVLIDRAKGGCDESFRQLIDRFYDYLILVADSGIHGKMQGKFGASDVVQLGLAKAHNAIERFDGNNEHQFRAWLKRVVINSLLNEARQYEGPKRQIERENSIGDVAIQCELTPSEIAVRNEEKQILRDYVGRLPAIEQRIIEMKNRFGYQFVEIADFLGISESAARRKFNRGVERLRQWFVDDEQQVKASE